MRITQSDLIKMVSNAEDIDESIVKKVLRSLELCVFDLLSSATQSHDVEVIPFKGFKLKAVYKKPSYSNLLGRMTDSKISVTGKVNKRYLNKINENRLSKI